MRALIGERLSFSCFSPTRFILFYFFEARIVLSCALLFFRASNKHAILSQLRQCRDSSAIFQHGRKQVDVPNVPV